METTVYLEQDGLRFELTLRTRDTQTHSRMQQCPNDIHGLVKGYLRETVKSIIPIVAANSSLKA